MAKVATRKSWATWFERRVRLRHYMSKLEPDPVLLALMRETAAYRKKRERERERMPVDLLPRAKDMRNIAVEVVRQTAPRIVDAAIRRRL